MNNDLVRGHWFIGGRLLGEVGGHRFDVRDPANGEGITSLRRAGAREAEMAIAAAGDALPAWRATLSIGRADALLRWHAAILSARDTLAEILTAEQGKPLTEAKAEIDYAAAFVRFYAEEARRIYGEIIPSHRHNTRISVIREPIGIVACITPWNFPAAMLTRKVAPALAAGCTVVLKPSELTLLTALALGALAEQAGLPPGTLNIVAGDAAAIGSALCDNPAVRGLSFTGSTPVGILLAERCARTVKRVGLELGGNAPFLVFDDADLDQAVEGAIISKFRNAGQTCVCTNRFLVQSGIHDAFVDRLTRRVASLRVGDGRLTGAQFGPLINERAVAKVTEHVADAVAQGARIRIGGGRRLRRSAAISSVRRC